MRKSYGKLFFTPTPEFLPYPKGIGVSFLRIYELIGRKINKVGIYHLSEDDCGIGLKFEGIDDTFFFWHNCDLEAE